MTFQAQELLQLLEAELTPARLVGKIILTAPIGEAEYSKIAIRPVTGKRGLFYQAECFYGSKVRHKNIAPEGLAAGVAEFLAAGYKQCQIYLDDTTVTLLTDKKRRTRVVRGKAAYQPPPQEHNTPRNYTIKEGTAVAWLVRLGVMTAEGKVLAQMQKKFRQINKFLEMISDISGHLPDAPVIIDFGCGKSYLTFAVYYYLEAIGKRPRVIGLDLKTDVIDECKRLAEDLGASGMEFHVGDIKDFSQTPADMLVALHACDTATDHALYYGLRQRCKVIMCVPCCQHELFSQVRNSELTPLLRHGILKERFAALLTDAVRAALLSAYGYSVTVAEFIDARHTPKNTMIRAVAGADAFNTVRYEEVRRLCQAYGIDPALCRLLQQKE